MIFTFPSETPPHHAIVDGLPFLDGLRCGEIEEDVRRFIRHDQRPHQQNHTAQRTREIHFIHLSSGCSMERYEDLILSLSNDVGYLDGLAMILEPRVRQPLQQSGVEAVREGENM